TWFTRLQTAGSRRFNRGRGPIMIFLKQFLFLSSFMLVVHTVYGEPFDKIVAVVDNEIILQSDIEEFEQMYKDQAGFSQLTEAARKRQILDKLIDDKILYAIAQQDTALQVMPEEIDSRASMHLERLMQENGGENRFATVLKQTNGMSVQEFKEKIKVQFREQILKQKLQEKYLGQTEPSHLEVQEFFDIYKDSLPVLKNNYKMSHFELSVNANRNLVKKSFKTCDSIITLINKGVAFKHLAEKLSDDPSGENGGDLGFIKKGLLDPSFEKAAFRLSVGEISRRPVRSKFGFHVIKVTAKRDVEIKVSHILIRIIPTEEDTIRTISFLDSLRVVALRDTNFHKIASMFSEDKKTKENGGDLGWFTEAALLPEYKAIVDTLPESDITHPILLNGKYHLFRLDKQLAERKLTLKDDWNQISMIAKNYIMSEKLAEFLKGWRKKVHIQDLSAVND
ncbi:MAG: peptidylprolyl isomerase, partial [Fibrobacteria bacterium]|nr:peptidylprolyl isomerase [Fibrobacteria bacterium]